MQGLRTASCVHGSTQSSFSGIARSPNPVRLTSPTQTRQRQPLSVEGNSSGHLTPTAQLRSCAPVAGAQLPQRMRHVPCGMSEPQA